MLDTRLPLIAEFLRDHQQFSRSLYEIKNLLGKKKIDEARQRAIELDVLAGPHIAYEELELYPRLAKLGDRSTSESLLLGQHQEILNALRSLIDEQEIDGELLKKIEAGFQTGLSHAEHCGSLISLMSQLDDQSQSDSLAELKRLRKQGRRWTEMDSI